MFYLGNWIDSFADNYQWSNASCITKGMAPWGAVSLGEIDEVVQRLHQRPQTDVERRLVDEVERRVIRRRGRSILADGRRAHEEVHARYLQGKVGVILGARHVGNLDDVAGARRTLE
mgnify:CR=1 FL=1